MELHENPEQAQIDQTPIEHANRRARQFTASHPRVLLARYDHISNHIVLHLSSRLMVAFLPQDAEGLAGATADQLSEIEISPSGFGIHFPRLDADLYIPSLLEGFLGSRRWMAARLGADGGKSTSAAKSHAARANGKKGGRPRKASTASARA